MTIHDYCTEGGKNLIKDGLKAFDGLDTRQLYSKLWEIKFFDNRIMYVIFYKDNVHFLHACKKQKGKAEQFELDKAITRAKEQNLL
jgi:phage-related protein